MWMMTTRRPTLTNDFASMQHRMDRLMTDLLGPNAITTNGASWVPAVDVLEDKDAIRIVAELPGVKPEDVKIALEHRTLTIRGEKKQVAEEQTEKVHRYERTYGSFERTFTLPQTVDAERVQASYSHGVLTVTVPRVEAAKPREIPVAVN